MREDDRRELHARAFKALEGGRGGNGDPVPAIVVDAAKVLSLLDYANSLEDLYRMHQQTETREMLGLKAERAVLLDQVAALQSEANSWQSGYDKGREMGGKHRSSEVEQLRAENERLRKDAERWRCVRNAVSMKSPYAVWREGSQVILGKDADVLVDNFLSSAHAGSANG